MLMFRLAFTAENLYHIDEPELWLFYVLVLFNQSEHVTRLISFCLE